MTDQVTVAQALKAGWLTDAYRLRVGLLKRPQPQVPHMTRPKYDLVLHDCDMFAAWLAWFETPKSKRGRRPEVWKRVPARAWTVQGEYELAHPKPQPPPPPSPPPNQPPSRWKNAPWTKKHVHISHGLRTDDGVWTVDQLVQRCLTYGARSVFAQIGDDCPDHDWCEHTRALYAAGKAAGLQVGAWGRVDYIGWDRAQQVIQSVLPLDGFLADVEARCTDQQLPEHLVAAFPGLPLGVIATGAIDQAFDNHSPQQVAARFGDFFDFVSQAYEKAGTNVSPDSMENFCYWRSTAKVAHGFRHLPDAGNHWQIPVGMSNAETTPPMIDQVTAFKPYSPSVGWWDAEIIEANGEWDVYASL